jgi:hypothetical protein
MEMPALEPEPIPMAAAPEPEPVYVEPEPPAAPPPPMTRAAAAGAGNGPTNGYTAPPAAPLFDDLDVPAILRRDRRFVQ